MKEVIDISEHNSRRGKIDWQAVKASGISGVMMRIGWAGYDGGIMSNNALDKSLDANIKTAHSVGLNVGLYVYTYTKTPEAARLAAAECVQIAKQYPNMINMPIAFDVEETSLPCLIQQGKEGLTDTVIAFLDGVNANEYYASWYTYTSFARQWLNLQRLANRDLWIADYRKNEVVMQAQLGRRDYGMWQHTGDKGTCPGITGACDLNHCYKEYPELIANAGMNGLKPTNTVDYKQLYEKDHATLLKIKRLLNGVS